MEEGSPFNVLATDTTELFNTACTALEVSPV